MVIVFLFVFLFVCFLRLHEFQEQLWGKTKKSTPVWSGYWGLHLPSFISMQLSHLQNLPLCQDLLYIQNQYLCLLGIISTFWTSFPSRPQFFKQNSLQKHICLLFNSSVSFLSISWRIQDVQFLFIQDIKICSQLMLTGASKQQAPSWEFRSLVLDICPPLHHTHTQLSANYKHSQFKIHMLLCSNLRTLQNSWIYI